MLASGGLGEMKEMMWKSGIRKIRGKRRKVLIAFDGRVRIADKRNKAGHRTFRKTSWN